MKKSVVSLTINGTREPDAACARRDAARGAAREPGPDRNAARLRAGRLRHLHGAGRRQADAELPAAGRDDRGARIDTIEGLTPAQGLHPIQEAFLEGFATQCGFCTSGMIMVAAGPDRRQSRARRATTWCAPSPAMSAAAPATRRSSTPCSTPPRACAGQPARRSGLTGDFRGKDRHELLRQGTRGRAFGGRRERAARRRARPRHRPHAVLRGRQLPQHAAPEDGALDAPSRADQEARPGAGAEGAGRGAHPHPQGRAQQLVHDPQADRRRARRRAGAAGGPRAVHGRADLRGAGRDARRPRSKAPAASSSTTRICPPSSTSRRR